MSSAMDCLSLTMKKRASKKQNLKAKSKKTKGRTLRQYFERAVASVETKRA